MHATTAQREHRHVRVEYLKAQRAQLGIQLRAVLHRQNFVAAERNQIHAQVFGLCITHVNKLEAAVA